MRPDTHDAASPRGAAGDHHQPARSEHRPGLSAALAAGVRKLGPVWAPPPRPYGAASGLSGPRLAAAAAVAVLLAAAVLVLLAVAVPDIASANTHTTSTTSPFRDAVNRDKVHEAQTEFLEGDAVGQVIGRVFLVLAAITLLVGVIRAVLKASKGGGGGGGGVAQFFKSLVLPILMAILLYNVDFLFDLVINGGSLLVKAAGWFFKLILPI